jgi:hypothetical protein
VKTVVLADVPAGSVVRINGRWGVVVSKRIVDFWDGGREYVKSWAVVEVQS